MQRHAGLLTSLIAVILLPLCALVRPSARAMIPDIEELCSRFKGNRQSELGKWHSDEEKAAVRSDLLAWYANNRRMLPWRGDEYVIEGKKFQKAPSAYGTWVSEIMLQQTRVDTVIKYWHNWMQKFPSIASLAAASPEDVNKMWAGLGYYSRAQRLLQGAKDVIAKHNGEVPSTIEDLKAIPGVGPYTAGAISSIAFGKAEPLVDGNVIRVFSRMRAITAGDKSKEMEKVTWSLASDIVDPEDAGSFNQALMELGATLCKPHEVGCATCPVAKHCTAHRIYVHNCKKEGGKGSISDISGVDGDFVADAEEKKTDEVEFPQSELNFPYKTPRKRPLEVLVSVVVYRNYNDQDGNNRFLFVRRPAKGLLANQWEFPSVIAYEEGNSAEKKAELKKSAEKLGKSEEAIIKNHMLELVEKMNSCHDPHLRAGPRGGGVEVLTPEGRVIQHTFSHQKHTMHVIQKKVDCTFVKEQENAGYDWIEDLEYTTGVKGCTNNEDDSKREHRWMTSAEIVEAGITSGCKKVLHVAEKAEFGVPRDAEPKPKPKKKRALSDPSEGTKDKSAVAGQKAEDGGAKQAKISSFFAPK